MSIKTLSPYYVTVLLTNPLTNVVCESYTVKLYIWNGSKTAVPLTPEYEITKINAAMSNTSEQINIARVVNDFIDFKCAMPTNNEVKSANNQVWCKYEIYYNDLPDVPSVQEVELAVKGYGLFLEGTNPQLPTNKVLIEGDEFKVNRKGYFVIPVLATEPTVAVRTLILNSFTLDTGTTYDYDVTANFSYTAIYFFVRPVGETEFTPLLGDSGSVIVPADIAADDFEVRATAFDTVTSANVNSDIETITV